MKDCNSGYSVRDTKNSSRGKIITTKLHVMTLPYYGVCVTNVETFLAILTTITEMYI